MLFLGAIFLLVFQNNLLCSINLVFPPSKGRVNARNVYVVIPCDAISLEKPRFEKYPFMINSRIVSDHDFNVSGLGKNWCFLIGLIFTSIGTIDGTRDGITLRGRILPYLN